MPKIVTELLWKIFQIGWSMHAPTLPSAFHVLCAPHFTYQETESHGKKTVVPVTHEIATNEVSFELAGE